jgi:chemotaxis protein MotB
VKFARWFNGLLGTLVIGCGVSQELYDTRTTELDRCQGELTRTQNSAASSRAKSDQLSGEATRMREDIAKLESERSSLATNLSATRKEMDELRRAHAQAEQRGELFRNLVARLRDMIDARTIAVDIRKGKMIVKVGDQILFDPGKAELKPEGQAALRHLATVLKEIADRDFLVAGHTDNKPIKSSPFRSNWELSTARAVTVVRFLQEEGMDPQRLAAAGYSEFDAIADNSTPENRAQNRRIEVVVMPKLDELPSIEREPVPNSPTHSDTPASAPAAPPVSPAPRAQ